MAAKYQIRVWPNVAVRLYEWQPKTFWRGRWSCLGAYKNKAEAEEAMNALIKPKPLIYDFDEDAKPITYYGGYV